MIDLPAILKDVMLSFVTIVTILVVCSVCEELKGRFDDSNIYLRCDWYHYPVKMRHILTIMVLQSQNLDVFKVIGSLTASRETCKKVTTRMKCKNTVDLLQNQPF